MKSRRRAPPQAPWQTVLRGRAWWVVNERRGVRCKVGDVRKPDSMRRATAEAARRNELQRPIGRVTRR